MNLIPRHVPFHLVRLISEFSNHLPVSILMASHADVPAQPRFTQCCHPAHWKCSGSVLALPGAPSQFVFDVVSGSRTTVHVMNLKTCVSQRVNLCQKIKWLRVWGQLGFVVCTTDNSLRLYWLQSPDDNPRVIEFRHWQLSRSIIGLCVPSQEVLWVWVKSSSEIEKMTLTIEVLSTEKLSSE